MKLLRRLPACGRAGAGGVLLAGWLFTGCVTTNEPPLPPVRGGPDSGGSAHVERFSIGDTVIVNFSSAASVSETQLQERQEQIKGDGTITLYLIGAVPAAGKTPGDLQTDIQKRYDQYLRNVTVTVKTQQRYYYVAGEVVRPSALAYVGVTTVTKAIAAAGGFTEYANKRKVYLTRPGQKPIRVDCIKAAEEPSLDPPVLPNDKVDVKRRIF